MIKALLIDIDNTLLDFNKCAESTIKKTFACYNLPFTENVMPTFHNVNDSLWLKIEDKTLTKEGLYAIRWQTIFNELGINFDGVAFEKSFREGLFYSCDKVDGAEAFLQYLQPKYILCAASNGPHKEQINRLRCASLYDYFRYVFVSEDAQSEKPDEKFFDYCMKNLNGITRKETMIIGDSLSADIRGGKRYGIKTCLFDFKQRGNIMSGSADYVISNLLDIKKIL